MKSIILKPHELQNIDQLKYLARPMKVQPPSEWSPYSYGEIHKMVNGEPDPDKVIGWGPCSEDGEYGIICPYLPGETVFVKETYWVLEGMFDEVYDGHRFGEPHYSGGGWCELDIGDSMSQINKSDGSPLTVEDLFRYGPEKPESFDGDVGEEYFRWSKHPSTNMRKELSRLTVKFTAVEAKQAKALSDEEIKGNCIKPDMVDSGGQNPDGSWINIADYGHPFLNAYKCTPDNWLWLWKVEVER